MRKVILGLAMIVGVIALMNLSQVSSLLADESADCKACKDKAQAACQGWKQESSRSADHCIQNYIASHCADVCKKKSGKGD
jgi:hypothetical protein